MEARSEPSGSAELLSSGPQSALNPAAPRLLLSVVSLTTGPGAEYTLGTGNVEAHICMLAYKKKNVKRRNKGTHTQRYIDFAVCPNSLLCTKKNNNYQLAYSQFMQGYEKLQNYFPMLFAPAFMYPLTHFHMFKRLNPFEFLLLYSVKAI